MNGRRDGSSARGGCAGEVAEGGGGKIEDPLRSRKGATSRQGPRRRSSQHVAGRTGRLSHEPDGDEGAAREGRQRSSRPTFSVPSWLPFVCGDLRGACEW